MARKLLLLTASALVLAPPGVAAAHPKCGGSTFSTCASVAINKQLKRDGNVRVRMDIMSEAYTREGAALGPIDEWRLGEEKEGDEAKLSARAKMKATQWREGEEASADVRKNNARRGKGRAVGRLEGDDRSAAVLVSRSRRPDFVELDLSKRSKKHVRGSDDDRDGDRKERDTACPSDARGEGKAGVLCEPVVVPEPSSFVLLASALAGLTALRWRRRQP